MLDKKWLNQNRELFEKSVSKRAAVSEYDVFLDLNNSLRSIIAKQENIRAAQNQIKGASEEAQQLKHELVGLTAQRNEAEEKLREWLLHQPNVLLDVVPAGASEADNQVVFESFTTLPPNTIPHFDLLDSLMMKEEAAHLSGSRFVVFKSKLAKLKRVLAAWMIEKNSQQGYEEYTIPYVVNESALYGTGQLPKFAMDAFKTTEGKWLISTGEIGLVNMFGGHVFDVRDLPKLCLTYSPCFRSEAGAAGRDTKGLVRVHQFHKVELVTLCTPEQAHEMHEKKLQAAKNILESLGLQYRVLLLCGADTGFTATKQYDIEVWMPGLGRFLEIASCSQCGTFQAMRADIRYKHDGKMEYVHTLNGSALPLERLIAAIVENYVNEDRTAIMLPECLHAAYGADRIEL